MEYKSTESIGEVRIKYLTTPIKVVSAAKDVRMQSASPLFDPNVKEELKKCFRRILQIMDPEFANSYRRCANLIDTIDEIAVEKEEFLALIDEFREIMKTKDVIDEKKSTEMVDEVCNVNEQIIRDDQVNDIAEFGKIQKVEDELHGGGNKLPEQKNPCEGDGPTFQDEIGLTRVSRSLSLDVDLLECLRIIKYMQIGLLVFTNAFFSLLVKRVNQQCTKSELNEDEREKKSEFTIEKEDQDDCKKSAKDRVHLPKVDEQNSECLQTNIQMIEEMLHSILMNSNCFCPSSNKQTDGQSVKKNMREAEKDTESPVESLMEPIGLTADNDIEKETEMASEKTILSAEDSQTPSDGIEHPRGIAKEEEKYDKQLNLPAEECSVQDSLESFLYFVQCYHPEYLSCIEKCIRGPEKLKDESSKTSLEIPAEKQEKLDVADESPETIDTADTPENKEIKTEQKGMLGKAKATHEKKWIFRPKKWMRAKEEAEENVQTNVRKSHYPDTMRSSARRLKDQNSK